MRGCFGCHAVGPIEEKPNRTQIRRRHGYNLASQGSKVSANWIANWVQEPRQVWAESKMPSLRLPDSEVADITAYLSSLKNAEWESKAAPQTDSEALDDVVYEFLRASSTEVKAKADLAAMNADQKNLYAGEKLIGRYGCYACHNIPGFENAQPIGTELTEAGSKLISQLDFGFLEIEHARAEWYAAKLQNPRVFDEGRVKRPEELLKMPNFGLERQGRAEHRHGPHQHGEGSRAFGNEGPHEHGRHRRTATGMLRRTARAATSSKIWVAIFALTSAPILKSRSIGLPA